MFWETLSRLCAENNTSPTSVITELQLSRGSVTSWKNGKVPHHSTLIKIADYFNVTVDYLLTGEQKESPSVTPTDERVKIAMEHINGLSSQELDVLIPLLEQMRKANKESQ